MKGSIVVCLQEMVEKKFGIDKWEAIKDESGIPANKQFYAHHEIEDPIVMQVVENTCKVLGITLEQAADAFGNYWMTEFAPKKYYAFVMIHNTAKSFLLGMKELHDKVTTAENASPPHFEFEEIDDKTITMKYASKRNMEVFWIGLIKGVGAHFKENIEIKRLEHSKVELTFEK